MVYPVLRLDVLNKNLDEYFKLSETSIGGVFESMYESHLLENLGYVCLSSKLFPCASI